MSGLAQIMEEPAGGANHGRSARNNLDDRLAAQLTYALGVDEWRAEEFMRGGGWGMVHAKDGARGGGSSHRGVLHPDEHVDPEVVRQAVEAELGFTYDEVRSVYRQGPLSPEARELRDEIDSRMLQLARLGTNLALLGGALGFPIKDNGNCRALENALARARKESE